jgi:hypothetical protein
MTEKTPDTLDAFHCPKCNSPIQQDSKFCEICGEKIEHPTVCRACGARLQADAQFCENCGTPVREGEKISEPPSGEISQKPGMQQFPDQAPGDDNGLSQARFPIPQRPESLPSRTPLPVSKNMMIVVGVAIVAVLALLIFVFVLPGFSGTSGATSSTGSHTIITATPSSITTRVTAVNTPGLSQSSVSLIPGPTQTIPPNQELVFQVDKDAVSAAVTVTVTGPSRDVVRDIYVQLTRSDGQVLSGHINPNQKVNEVTIPGSRSTDRVEVTVTFYSGDSYKVIDKTVDFARRM